MKIKNKNHFSHRMIRADLVSAIEMPSNAKTNKYIHDVLVGEGWFKKLSGGRYYEPTTKVLNAAFVPDLLELTKQQIRALSLSDGWYKPELVVILGNEHIFHQMIALGYLYQDSSRRYKKEEEFSERLVDGDVAFSMLDNLNQLDDNNTLE